jgi:hypothetical protein
LQHDHAPLRPYETEYGAAAPALDQQQVGRKAMMDVNRVVVEMCRATVGKVWAAVNPS